MKLPLSLLKSFISIDLPPKNIAETLTLLGIEVDAIHSSEARFHRVVVAKIESVARHPSAEKLQVAQVFDGTNTVQVVCGAPNCRKGLHTAFAKVGATLIDAAGKSRQIEKTSIRGVESHGMLCSAEELSLYDDNGGILELSTSFPLGSDCVELLWDPVLEISLTPNLGHCMSALGIARELSAAWQKPLLSQRRSLHQNERSIDVQAHVENGHLCPRYMARVVEKVKVGPSPFWLQKTLLSSGLRPINNIVDVTNYILLKYGQPMHAFDLAKIEGKKVIVQVAEREIKFNALNDSEISIAPGTLLISDAKKPIAIAGIIGGSNSSVTETTTDILLEVACFDPINIRTSSKKINLRTDSSLRFEKGIDIDAMSECLDEAAALIAELTQGSIVKGVIDCKKLNIANRRISFRWERANQILGTKLSETEVEGLLRRLGFLIEGKMVTVPSYRNDVTEEIDLIEEVARLYGYNNIERPLPRATTPQIPHDEVYQFERMLRERLISLGLQEFLTCDLISPKLAGSIEEFAPSKNTLLTMLHSKSEEYSILRPALLPGLLEVARANIDHKNHQFSAFELGRIHFSQNGKIIELPMAALLLTGKEAPMHWGLKPKDYDFFDLKGLVENLLQGLRIPTLSFKPSNHLSFHPGRQAELYIQNTLAGTLGELHPDLLAKFSIKQRIYYAEFNAESLRTFQPPSAKMIPLSLFPSSERDWTLSLDPKTRIASILDQIQKVHCPILEKCEVIDLYRAEEKTNVTLRFTYRDPAKTVNFEEVEAAHQTIMQTFSYT